jgi:hypothetical protein
LLSIKKIDIQFVKNDSRERITHGNILKDNVILISFFLCGNYEVVNVNKNENLGSVTG